MKSKRGISYQLEGNRDGLVIVFSNSLGTEMSSWDEVVELLKDDFSILRYDIRGHGQSDVIDSQTTTVSDLALDVVDLLDTLEIKKAWFCGISLGGLTGMKLAIDHPELFHGFVVANTSPRIATAEIWEKRIELIKNQGMIPVAEGAAARWYTENFIMNNSALVLSMKNYLMYSSPVGYSACCEALMNENLWSELERIHSPFLIISGKHDEITTENDALKMQSLIPKSQMKTLAANHLSNVECPKEFAASIRNFIFH